MALLMLGARPFQGHFTVDPGQQLKSGTEEMWNTGPVEHIP